MNEAKTTKRKHKKVRVIVGLAFVAGTVLGVSHMLSAPATGHKVTIDESYKKIHQTSAPVAPGATITNPYFTINLPAGYKQQVGATTPAGELFGTTIIKQSTFGSLIVAIRLTALPDGGLTQDSSYALTAKESNEYAITTQVKSGDTLSIANDNLNADVVAFWPHNGYLATIGVSSGIATTPENDNSDIMTALEPLLNNLQWQ